jgi:hypothetical protein
LGTVARRFRGRFVGRRPVRFLVGSRFAGDFERDRGRGVRTDDAHDELVLAGLDAAEVHPDDVGPVETARRQVRLGTVGDPVDLLVAEARSSDVDVVRLLRRIVNDVEVEHAAVDRIDGVGTAVPEACVQRIVSRWAIKARLARVLVRLVFGVLCADRPDRPDGTDGRRHDDQAGEKQTSVSFVRSCHI